MGSLRKVGVFLGLVAGSESRDDEYPYAADEYADEHEPEYNAYPDPVRPMRSAPYSADLPPVVPGAVALALDTEQAADAVASSSGMRPLTVKLSGFGEARVIGERYREGASVILDMTDLSDGDARRVVDFAAGLAFALHGSIDKVTARVFMLLPPQAEHSREVQRDRARRSLGRV